jgi:hypothetical protein
MTNETVVDELAAAKDAAMRITARALIRAYQDDNRANLEDFIVILGFELSKHVDEFARRTGDYSRASTPNLVADHLMELDDVIENYDGAPKE